MKAAFAKITMFFFISAFLTAFLTILPSWVKAVYSPGDRTDIPAPVRVSAHVDDTISPTIPILISPSNGSYLNNRLVTFCFKKSTDAGSPIWYYQLFLNGQLYLEEIAAAQSPVETENFSLSAFDDYICVTLKEGLNDGQYTWKIRVYDSYKNFADSATWTFTIDTIAPFIIVTQVGENENLNLSSSDPASIPADFTLQTWQTKPEFAGKSEPGSLVQITLISSKDNEIYLLPVGQVSSTGNFSIKPEQDLPLGLYQVIVAVSDTAGNTTVLPQFKLLILAKKPPIVPFPWPVPPLIKKPEALLQMPATAIEAPLWQKSLPFITLLLLLLYLILLTIGLGVPFNLVPLLILLLLLLRRKKQSLTYQADNKKGLSFVTLKIFKIIQEKTGNLAEEINSFLSDIEGRFELDLLQSTYKIKASRAGFIFPSRIVTGQEDGEYKNIYHGELLSTPGVEFALNQHPMLIAHTKHPVLQAAYAPPTPGVEIQFISIPLDPDKTCYSKYQRIILLAKLICFLALISSLFTVLFLPNILTLLLFLLCLWLMLRSLRIH